MELDSIDTSYRKTRKRAMSETKPLALSSDHVWPLERDKGSLLKSIRHHTGSTGSRGRQRSSGWRGGVLLAIFGGSTVLLVNIILAILASTAWELKDGIATAYTGSCTHSNNLTLWIHLLINILSSLLLGASNYCMQRLVAPTRQEVDKAHAQRKWLDIGVPSVKNLFHIKKSRVILWILLAITSVPLHFLYNSVAFQTIAAREVYFSLVTEPFFTNASSWNYQAPGYAGNASATYLNSSTSNYVSDLQNTLLDGKYRNPDLFTNLSVNECKSQYSAAFITNYGNAFAVMDDSFADLGGANNSVKEVRFYSELVPDFYARQIRYCLAQVISPQCQVQFSLYVLMVVIICNLLKICVMGTILWRCNKATLVTIGDAIASFLENPDATTENCCLMSKDKVRRLWDHPELRINQRWEPRSRTPWIQACSPRRWAACLSFYTIAIVTASVLLTRGGVDEHPSGNGLGEVNTSFLIDMHIPWADSVIPYIMLANLPQFILSFIYFTYNGLWTCMLVDREWSQYSIKRAPLRTTIPKGQQRSTYFLQLPYTWSVPLMAASIFLHWIVSQSIFLARVASYDTDGKQISAEAAGLLEDAYHHISDPNGVLTAVGWSDKALKIAIGWGIALVCLCLIIPCILRYPEGIPLGGSSSAVISAACHPRYEPESGGDCDSDGWSRVESDVAEKAVMWGVTTPGERLERVGHCAFSSREVEPPTFGHLYAGTDRGVRCRVARSGS